MKAAFGVLSHTQTSSMNRNLPQGAGAAKDPEAERSSRVWAQVSLKAEERAGVRRRVQKGSLSPGSAFGHGCEPQLRGLG